MISIAILSLPLHSLPTADSSRAVVSYWRKYGALRKPAQEQCRSTDHLNMTLIVLTWLYNLKTNNDLGLHLPRPVCPNTYANLGIVNNLNCPIQ